MPDLLRCLSPAPVNPPGNGERPLSRRAPTGGRYEPGDSERGPGSSARCESRASVNRRAQGEKLRLALTERLVVGLLVIGESADEPVLRQLVEPAPHRPQVVVVHRLYQRTTGAVPTHELLKPRHA